METEKVISKPAKWFTNKGLRLSFQRLKNESSSRRSLNYAATRALDSPSSKLSTPRSPNSPLTPRTNINNGNNNNNISRQDELKEVFRHFDTDGDGKISAVELRAYFASIGEYMSYEDAQGVIRELDTDGDESLDFQDFLRLMKRGADLEDLKKAFEMFELEKGDGCITPRGLQRMLQRLGDDKSLDDCVAMIQVYDTDGDGVLDFQEFHQMMA